MTEDLLTQVPTPITDKHIYKTTEKDVGYEVLAPTIARGLERRIAALKDVMARMDRALQRDPFEGDDGFANRRRFAHELYLTATKEQPS